ncbi:aldehyde dehydrogenase family protein [Streptomyces sp. NPDC002896]|uniref:aldehyde dehydrogenase family protein n=1 Tax=Streptomyces sp. NPDC002896 TaxID=3154438 RepID=UPI003321BA77
MPSGLEQLARTPSPQPLPDAVCLVQFLAGLPDPRDRRDRRFPLTALVAAAAAGTLAGARSLTAIAEWIADAPRWVLLALGFSVDPFTRAVTVPHPTTVMRLLGRLDGDAFDTAVSAFLQARAQNRQAATTRWRAVAVDGKQLRGSRAGGGKAVWLLAAMDHTGTVNAQRQIDAKSNETPAFIPLLDGLALENTVVTADGAHTQHVAAKGVKPVALELGGKSASVLLDDADLDAAVTAGVQGCFINSGQTCSALTRMLVPRRLLDEVEQRIVALVDEVKVGDPFDPETTLGPLAGRAQRDRVAGFVDGALDAGTRLLAGGPSAASSLPKTGFYAPPAVFTDVDAGSRLAQEEVFGPVLAVIPYDGGDEEAVALANDSDYGLSGAVWSADPARALAVARRIRTGQVSVNDAAYNPLAPFGGVKRSGHGRELGPHGLMEFTTLKAIQR